MSKQTNKKYKLGLALSGGGARGFAHIGVFKLLEECGLHPDIIAGTSAGALMGTLYADGYRPDEIMELFTGREFSEFASMQLPKMGLFDSGKFNRYIRKVIRAKRFEELQIPVVVMTTDLDRGKAHAFVKGEIPDIITASCSMPILFNPVSINGAFHVDGGLFNNFPVSIIRNDCEAVIGSNVSPTVPGKYNKTIVGVAERSYHYLFRANTEKDRELCDILIETDEFGKYKMFDLKNVELMVDIGYRAAIHAFDEFLNNRPIANLIKSYSSKAVKSIPNH
ncbi:MAG: patatin-like phospholipase family protein [Tannerella sp.]|jgi:NTE family protein|nr:patatin-like phospholipase family protein [Tannerella sp.]